MSMIQAVSYNFSTVENTLSDGGVFTIVADTTWTGSLKVIAGNLCEPASLSAPGIAFYSGSVAAPSNAWPADQYTEITLTTFSTANIHAYLFVRQGAFNSGTQYHVNLDFTAQTWALTAIVGNAAHALVTATAQASAQGDVFRLSVTGNILSLSRNGSVVQSFTDTNNYITSGSPGFGLYDVTALNNAQTSLWAGGANQAAAPVFSLNGGSFGNPQTVTLFSLSSNSGTIYYTTDGTTPTHASSSIVNGGTISVNENITIKAIASIANFLDSPVAVSSGSYTNTVVDLFQRTAANLGGNWTNYLNGFTAASAAVPSQGGATNYNVAAYTGISFSGDQSATVVYSTITGGSQGPCVRIQGTPTSNVSYYVAAITPSGVILVKIIGATNTTTGTTNTTLATYSPPVPNGTAVTLSVVGSTLTLFVGGVSVEQVNDTTLTGGAPGIHEYLQDGSIALFTATSQTPVTGVVDNFVIDGDSIAFGYNVQTPWDQSLTLNGGPWSVSNLGVPSRTLATCMTNAATSVDPLYIPGIHNVLFIWAGVNDFAGGASAATVYANIQTYVAARKAVGWEVVVSPLCSNVTQDAKVQTYNGLLAGSSAFADATVVLPTTLIGTGAYSNATYFQADEIHPNQTSNTNIEAPDISTAVNSLAGNISGSLGVAGAGVTVSYTGTASGSVIADGSGNYSITGLANGTYTLTPGKSKVAFSPTSQTVTINYSSASGVNFVTFTPSSSGSGSGRIAATGAGFATRIESPRTEIMGTNLRTRILE